MLSAFKHSRPLVTVLLFLRRYPHQNNPASVPLFRRQVTPVIHLHYHDFVGYEHAPISHLNPPVIYPFRGPQHAVCSRLLPTRYVTACYRGKARLPTLKTCFPSRSPSLTFL